MVDGSDALLAIHKISGPLADRMLTQAGLDSTTTIPFQLLDNGCGVGIVAAALHRHIQPEVLKQSSILCGDITQDMADKVNRTAEQQGWVNTQARVIDAQSPGLDAASLSHVTMNIGFHVVPDSEKALDESLKLLKPGGTLAFTTWHQSNQGWAPDLKAAFESFPFEAPLTLIMQTTKWGEWADVNWIRRTLEDRGLQDVQVNVLSHLNRIESPAAFLGTFSMMIDWLMNAQWSEETRQAHGREEVLALTHEFLEKKYQGRPWDLTWTSIIATARVPS
ncbi:methyltransferase-like protein [Thozetella sp. PMI_491]|nr:methyltransferase-like protein [Thozetella sp. PMI_491]